MIGGGFRAGSVEFDLKIGIRPVLLGKRDLGPGVRLLPLEGLTEKRPDRFWRICRSVLRRLRKGEPRYAD
jgi:hypothetical protein